MEKFEAINTTGERINLLINLNKSITLNPGERKKMYEKAGSTVHACRPNEHAKKISLGVVDGSTKTVVGL